MSIVWIEIATAKSVGSAQATWITILIAHNHAFLSTEVENVSLEQDLFAGLSRQREGRNYSNSEIRGRLSPCMHDFNVHLTGFLSIPSIQTYAYVCSGQHGHCSRPHSRSAPRRRRSP